MEWRLRCKKALVVFTTIRTYEPEDKNGIVLLYQAVFAEPPWCESWDADEVGQDLDYALSQESPIVLVAKNSELVGFTWGYRLKLENFNWLTGRVSDNTAYMDEIAVKTGSRLKGVGTLLGNRFLDLAAKQGLSEVVLRTDERNDASMALFRKLGFRQLGVRDPRYPERIYLGREVK